VACYIWYSEEGPWRAAAPPSPLLAVPNDDAVDFAVWQQPVERDLQLLSVLRWVHGNGVLTVLLLLLTRVWSGWVDTISLCRHHWGTGRGMLSLKVILGV